MSNWKGVNCSFRHMHPIDFMTYERIFELYEDLIDSVEAILGAPSVRAPGHIEDKVH